MYKLFGSDNVSYRASWSHDIVRETVGAQRLVMVSQLLSSVLGYLLSGGMMLQNRLGTCWNLDYEVYTMGMVI